MARKGAAKKKEVADYRHEDTTRLNNPTAPLARDDVGETPKRRFEFDPHLDPQLVWAGKAEQAELEVDAPTLHIHERISTEAIIRHAQREEPQISLFADPELERSKAIEFYEHEMGWANRLILGDSLHVMTSLLERERIAGHVQVIYVDPPYGVNYNSNFQARISNRSPKETSDDTITREPEMIQAYRDTWELGIHSYLTYLRERLLVSRELLAESGSVFVQISLDNVHLVRTVLDEVFGRDNAITEIAFVKTSGAGSPSGGTKLLAETYDVLLWYAKSRADTKYRPLYTPRADQKSAAEAFSWLEADGKRRRLTSAEISGEVALPQDARLYTVADLTSQKPTTVFDFEYEGRTFNPLPRGWRTTEGGMDRLAELGRLQVVGNTLRYVQFLDDAPYSPVSNFWADTGVAGFASRKRYVVETNPKVVARCLAMASDPGDLVLDPTCGGGTTAYAAEMLGRRWITTDTSRVALSLARARMLTSHYPFYRLVDEARGVDGGLRYEAVRRVSLRALARSEDSEDQPLYDRPLVDLDRIRVSGPFTVEALSRYAENPDDESSVMHEEATEIGDHVGVLLDALRTNGVPRRGSKPLRVVRLEPISSSGALQAEGTYEVDGKARAFAVSVGPRYGPITQIQVDEALDERAGYDLICFAGFAATAEAQAYLAPGKRGKVEVALLEANADLLLGDLLKNTKASQTFRLFAAPDAEVRRATDGQVSVTLLGMDSYDAATGEVLSRGQDEIAAWFLDHDYDGSCFHVNQAFFTRSNAWEALSKALKDSVDRDALEQLSGFESLPFKPRESKKCAIRVIDDAGQTSEAILPLP